MWLLRELSCPHSKITKIELSIKVNVHILLFQRANKDMYLPYLINIAHETYPIQQPHPLNRNLTFYLKQKLEPPLFSCLLPQHQKPIVTTPIQSCYYCFVFLLFVCFLFLFLLLLLFYCSIPIAYPFVWWNHQLFLSPWVRIFCDFHCYVISS